MKNLMIVFMVLLASVQGFSQKKGKVDPETVKIDSLMKATVKLTAELDSTTKSSAALTMKLDSVSKDRDKYHGVYTAVKDKVIKYKFDPAKTSMLIDSLKSHRDSTFSGLTATSSALNDTIKALKTANTKLQSTINTMTAAESDKDKIIAELKQLKDLLDSKIITQEEYDAKKAKLMAKW